MPALMISSLPRSAAVSVVVVVMICASGATAGRMATDRGLLPDEPLSLPLDVGGSPAATDLLIC